MTENPSIQVAHALFDVLTAVDYDRLDPHDVEQARAVEIAVGHLNHIGALTVSPVVDGLTVHVRPDAGNLVMGAIVAMHALIREAIESARGELDEHDVIARARGRLDEED
jgi:hypothetical protein